MKKIFLFFFLTMYCIGFSQKVQIPTEYTIKMPLRLETVKQGSKSDSVLVRGADKITKFVPRSEFTSNVDLPTPEINQVLNSGNNVFDKYLYFRNSSNSDEKTILNSFFAQVRNINSASSVYADKLQIGSLSGSNSFTNYEIDGIRRYDGVSSFLKYPTFTSEIYQTILPVKVNNVFADDSGNIKIGISEILATNSVSDLPITFSNGTSQTSITSDGVSVSKSGSGISLNTLSLNMNIGTKGLQFDPYNLSIINGGVTMPISLPLADVSIANKILPVTLNTKTADTYGNFNITLNDIKASIGLDVPTTSTSIGNEGDVRFDIDYIYICTANNTWKRSPLTTW